ASHVQPIPLFHLPLLFSVFFFNAPAPTEIYTLSLHDALPISAMILRFGTDDQKRRWVPRLVRGDVKGAVAMTEPQAGSDVGNLRSEEHTSELQSPYDLVCRLLLEKKKTIQTKRTSLQHMKEHK